MKNIFFMLLCTLLFVFVANQTFANEAEDPVKFEQVIYYNCEAVVPCLFSVFIPNELYKSRDNIETEKAIYKDISKNCFATVANIQHRK